MCSQDMIDTAEGVSYEVDPARMEAGEVLEELEAEGKPVALLICDHIMPGQNGIDFLIDVAADPGRFPHLKKILLTGLATHQDTITAINRAAIDRYLEKPWERETLLEAVRALLTEFIMRSGMDPEPFQAIFDTPTYLREARRRGGV